jgi:hypothetical protein
VKYLRHFLDDATPISGGAARVRTSWTSERSMGDARVVVLGGQPQNVSNPGAGSA